MGPNGLIIFSEFFWSKIVKNYVALKCFCFFFFDISETVRMATYIGGSLGKLRTFSGEDCHQRLEKNLRSSKKWPRH